MLNAYIFRVLSVMGVRVPDKRTFFRYQESFLHKAVGAVWQRQQEQLKEKIHSDNIPLTMAGDSRCDSMGHR